MSSRFRFESQGEQGPRGAQGPAGASGLTGAQGPIGLTGAQGPTGLTGAQGSQGVSGIGVGARGAQGQIISVLRRYDSNMAWTVVADNTIGVNTAVGARQTYLPGGNWGVRTSDNHVPGGVDSFNFLKIKADMGSVGGGEEIVYVPCYWRS